MVRPLSAPSRSSRYLHGLAQATEALQHGRPQDARRLLEQALALEPDEPRGLNLLGLAYFKLGLLGGAKRVYDKLVERFEAEPALHVNLGLVLLRQGRLTESERSLRRAIELDAGHRRAHCYLGLVLFRRGDLSLAREHFLLGEAHDFAQKVERRLSRLSSPRPSQLEQLQTVGQQALLQLDVHGVPFRPLDSLDEPIVRDEEAWEARVGHHQQVPMAEPAESDSFVQATGSRELSEARAAARQLQEPPPELEFDLRAESRDRLQPHEVRALIQGEGREGFVAGPRGRAKLTLQGETWLRPEAVVCTFSDGQQTWMGPGRGPFRPMIGPRVALLAVPGVAVALRQAADLGVDRSRLFGFEGSFQRTGVEAWGETADLLRGAGSVLLSTSDAPLAIPLEAGQSLGIRRATLVAWSLGLDVVRQPTEDPMAVLRCQGPGWVLVADPSRGWAPSRAAEEV